uniref:Uncharacterized protein n=1 Tax=viral metagenome TaxID=1070528 RepID=A0A6M3Y540_9ZZZZ
MKCPRCSRTMREVSRREPTWRDADKTTEVVYLCRCGRKAAEVTSAAAGACRDLDPSHNAPWGDSTHLRLQRREGSQKAPSMAALLNVLRDVYSEPPEKPKPTAVRVGQVWEYHNGLGTSCRHTIGDAVGRTGEVGTVSGQWLIASHLANGVDNTGVGTWRLVSDAPAEPGPLPKPERVEVGQRWEWVGVGLTGQMTVVGQRWEWVGDEPTGQMTVVGTADGGRVFMAENPYGSYYAQRLEEDDDWRYLGGNDDT